jgi:hypothetical protein
MKIHQRASRDWAIYNDTDDLCLGVITKFEDINDRPACFTHSRMRHDSVHGVGAGFPTFDAALADFNRK